MPVSATTYYLIKLRNNSNNISLTVNSSHSKTITVRTKSDVI